MYTNDLHNIVIMIINISIQYQQWIEEHLLQKASCNLKLSFTFIITTVITVFLLSKLRGNLNTIYR